MRFLRLAATGMLSFAAVGNRFEVIVRERPHPAEQVKLPFYRRSRD